MSHAYTISCDCKHCAREQTRRAAQSAVDPRNTIKPKRQAARRRHASKEEQYGRYLDCGPDAWDDR